MSSEMRRDARRIIKLASLGVAALGVSALGYALAKSLDLQRDTGDDEAWQTVLNLASRLLFAMALSQGAAVAG